MLPDISRDDRVVGHERGSVAHDPVGAERVVGSWHCERKLGAQGRHPRYPVAPTTRLDERCDGFQSFAHISLDSERGLLDLAELALVYVDMHDRRVPAELRRLARRAIVEANSKPDEQIAFLEQHIGVTRRMHADHAEVEGMIVRDSAEAMQSRSQWYRGLSGDTAQHGGRRRHDDSTAEEEDWAPRIVDELGGAGDIGVGKTRRRVRPRWFRERLELDRLRLHVLRHIDRHRPGTARYREAKGLW